MYIASKKFAYYPEKDTYGDSYGSSRDYYLRTMFTCSNLDCDYYKRFLCRRHVLFIRAFQYKPVCPACTSEVLHTNYWDPTNYRRVFVNGRINREVLSNQNNSAAGTDRSRISLMVQSLELTKRLNLDISGFHTQRLATVAFEYNLEVDLQDLRKIYIINSLIPDEYIDEYIRWSSCVRTGENASLDYYDFSDFYKSVDDNDFSWIDRQISEIKNNILKFDSGYYLEPSIDEIAELLSPNLIDPTQLSKSKGI